MGPGDRAPAGPPPADEVRPSRRWRRRIGCALLALVALLGAAYLSREVVLHPLIARGVAWAAPRLAPYEVELDDLSGDWFRSLRLDGLRVMALGPEGALRELEVDHASVHLRPLELLRGNLAGLEAVRVGRARVTVDATAAPEGDEDEPPDGGWPSLPRRPPLVDVESLDAHVALGGGDEVAVRGLSLDSRRAGEATLVDVRLDEVRALGHGASELGARVAWDGGEARVDRMTAGGSPAAGSIAVDLSRLASEELGWRFDVELFGGRARGEGRLEEAVQGELELAGVDLGRAGRLAGELVERDWPATVAGRADLELTGRIPLDAPGSATADARLTVHDPAFAGRRAGELEAELAFSDGELSVPALTVRAGEEVGRAEDVVLPLTGGAEVLLREMQGRVALEARDVFHWIHGDAAGQEEPPPEHHLELRGSVGQGRVRLAGGRLEAGGGAFVLDSGSIALLPEDGTRPIELDLVASFDDLEPLGRLLGREGWAGSLDGRVAVAGHLPRPTARLELYGDGVTIEGVPLGEIDVAASAGAESITVRSLAAESEHLRLEATGSYRLDSGELSGVRLSLDVLALEELSPVFAPGGRLEVDAALSGPPSVPSGTLSLTGVDVAAGAVELDDLRVEASASDGTIDVRELAFESTFGNLSAVATVELVPSGESTVTLRSLRLESDGRSLSLASDATAAWGAGALRVGPLELAGSGGRLALAATRSTERLQAEVEAEDLALDAFLAPLLPEGAELSDVALELEATLEDGEPAVTANGTVGRARVPGDDEPWTATWRGSLAGERIVLDELSVERGAEQLVDLRASLPLAFSADPPLGDGPLELEGSLAVPADLTLPVTIGGVSASVTAPLEGEVALGGSWRRVTGTVRLAADEVVAGHDEEGAGWGPLAASVRAEVALGDTVSIERLDVDVRGRGEVHGRATAACPLDVVELLERGTAAFGDAPLSGEFEVEVEDLSWVADHVDALRRLDGRARGSATIGGSAARPELVADLEVREGSLRLPDATLVEELEADLRYAQEALEIRRVSAEIGAAPLELSGRVGLAGPEPELELVLRGQNVLLARSSDLRVRGDLDLAAAGPWSRLVLRGGVQLRNSRVLQDIDLLGFLRRRSTPVSVQRGLALPTFREPPLSTTRFDVELETAEPIQLLGNVARGDVRLDLHLGGTGESLVPSGRVFLDSARVKLPGGTMAFPSGLISFDEGNPYVPTLSLSGEARLAGYDVRLTVTGPYDEPVVEASSSPPLATDDLLLLILTGTLPPAGQAGRATAQSLGVYVAKDVISKWAGGDGLGETDEQSFFDRIEIVSGREVSKGGVMTMEVTYRWREEEEARGRGDAWLLVGERDVYEDYNMGLRFVFRVK